MLAQLDNLIFKTDSNILELSEKYNFNFAQINRIKDNATYQNINGITQEINFSGYFILKDINELNSLKKLAITKRPIWLITIDEAYMVIVVSLDIKKRIFLKDGGFIRQDFNISLKRFFK